MFTVAEGESDMAARPLGWAVSAAPGTAFYLSASTPGTAALMAALLADPQVLTVTADVKRDYVILRNFLPDTPFQPAAYYDIALAHYVLEPEMRHNIELLAMHYLGRQVPDLEEVAGKGAKRPAVLAAGA